MQELFQNEFGFENENRNEIENEIENKIENRFYKPIARWNRKLKRLS